MIKNYIGVLVLMIFVLPLSVFGQEVRIFTLEDFDLKDSVKTCLVSTKYGKEEYDFNRKGLLTKSVTRYNEADYDVVYYKYRDSLLVEKRSETYRDNKFDPSTSIAHFFELDTTENRKITEKIISYDKEFLDQYVYTYDDKGDLTKMVRINNEGTDETLVEYKKYKGEFTITYLLNEVPLKSIRTSYQKKNGENQKIVLTKEFLKGEGNKAYEEVFNEKDMLLARQEFEYDATAKKFIPTIRTSYEYDEKGMLVEEVTRGDNLLDKKEYIYQYDKEEGGNWVKQIITPENAYVTRKITYYKQEKKEK
ncbi:hypothetical protein [Maribacter cobaltidurans]|uniref:Uncharacterized protein n=1 Tax=Maribacter cobaltidurans TaxID=1178778 RepID=A0A223V0K8_9FLAO|nr:hypothetical protein [Maribacter cobaltidurans]ASV28822.1 hypothetical protein CJ263_00450 [Maribacter cobaltidurans]GGD74524.1 hypothetical protein GCM10011412_10250 [Maribacter cobaltidurans]